MISILISNCLGVIREKFDMVFSTVGKAYSVMILQHSERHQKCDLFLNCRKGPRGCECDMRGTHIPPSH